MSDFDAVRDVALCDIIRTQDAKITRLEKQLACAVEALEQMRDGYLVNIKQREKMITALAEIKKIGEENE